MAQKKLLIIDDEVDIVEMLTDYFELSGYLVYSASSGQVGLVHLAKLPDLILLDVSMPGMDGFEFCQKVRTVVHCPIIFLSAKVDQESRIKGLMVGGDDYLMKPLDMAELAARVQAHIRRDGRLAIKEELQISQELTILYDQRQLFCQQNEIKLTKTEFEIVSLLSRHSGKIYTKEHIYECLWGFDKEGDSSIITEHVRRIRQKIEQQTETEVIETVWGVGYKWIG